MTWECCRERRVQHAERKLLGVFLTLNINLQTKRLANLIKAYFGGTKRYT